MEPLTYTIIYGCWLVFCWLLHHTENHPIPPPKRYLRKPTPKKRIIRLQQRKLWF